MSFYSFIYQHQISGVTLRQVQYQTLFDTHTGLSVTPLIGHLSRVLGKSLECPCGTTKTPSTSHSYQRLLLFAQLSELKSILQAALLMVLFEESSRAKKSICNPWKVVCQLLHHVLVM